jgi:Core-2/I-Branching enzyme
VKIALLVLAYRYPLGLRALSVLFPPPTFQVIVHVDSKVDEQPFVACASPSVHFLKDRIAVYWRGWSIVEATMRLILYARSTNSFDRYMLISDDSVPIKSSATIRETLETHADHILIHPAGDRAWRYEKFYMFDSQATQLRWTSDREVTEEAVAKIERLGALRGRGKIPLKEQFQGSQWWVLSPQRIEEIVSSWSDDTWLRDSFEFSDAPDEGYFHTILASKGLKRSRSMMWVDWKTSNPPPHTYKSGEELAQIRPTTEFFARTIDFSEAQLGEWIARIGSAQ